MANNSNTDQNDHPSNSLHTDVSGAITQHTPPYWRLAMPALGVRYLARYVQQFKAKHNSYFDRAAGMWMMGVTGLFAYNTLNDMTNVFAETVAFEMGKKPEDVKSTDLWHSKNPAIVTTRDNFVKYNFQRLLANSTFFVSSIADGVSKKFSINGLENVRDTPAVDLGVPANGIYLMTEIMGRKRTFFEQVQSFIDNKLSNKNDLGADILPEELMQLFQRNAIDNQRNEVLDVHKDPATLKQSRVIFERMAELMNSTYMNKDQKQNGEKDHFAMPEFLYLTGFNLIQPSKVDQTLAYIEIANKRGMQALKEAVKDVEQGANAAMLAQKYDVAVMKPLQVDAASMEKDSQATPGKYTQIVSQRPLTSQKSKAFDLAAITSGRDESFARRLQDAPNAPLGLN